MYEPHIQSAARRVAERLEAEGTVYVSNMRVASLVLAKVDGAIVVPPLRRHEAGYRLALDD